MVIDRFGCRIFDMGMNDKAQEGQGGKQMDDPYTSPEEAVNALITIKNLPVEPQDYYLMTIHIIEKQERQILAGRHG